MMAVAVNSGPPSACCRHAAGHAPLRSRKQQELQRVVAGLEEEEGGGEIERKSKVEGRAKVTIERG